MAALEELFMQMIAWASMANASTALFPRRDYASQVGLKKDQKKKFAVGGVVPVFYNVNGVQTSMRRVQGTFKPGLKRIPGNLMKINRDAVGAKVYVVMAESAFTIGAAHKIRVPAEVVALGDNIAALMTDSEEQPVFKHYSINLSMTDTDAFCAIPFLLKCKNGGAITPLDQNDGLVLDAIATACPDVDRVIVHGPLAQSKQISAGVNTLDYAVDLTPWANAYTQLYAQFEIENRIAAIPEFDIGIAVIGQANQSIEHYQTLAYSYTMRKRRM